MTFHVYVAQRLRVMEFIEHVVYNHLPHNDFSVDGPHIRQWPLNLLEPEFYI